MTAQADFEEIAHTGGKVTFKVRPDEQGRTTYQVGWSHSDRQQQRSLVFMLSHRGLLSEILRCAVWGYPGILRPFPAVSPF